MAQIIYDLGEHWCSHSRRETGFIPSPKLLKKRYGAFHGQKVRWNSWNSL